MFAKGNEQTNMLASQRTNFSNLKQIGFWFKYCLLLLSEASSPYVAGHKPLKPRTNNRTILHRDILCYFSTEFQNVLKQ